MPTANDSNRCHSQGQPNIDRAYRITNGKLDACSDCRRLAWILVAIDLDSRIDDEEDAA